MSPRAALLTPLALLAASPALAQEAEEEGEPFAIMNSWSTPAQCGLDKARRLSVPAAIRGLARLRGECVAVDGHWSLNALFAKPSDALKPHARWNRRIPHFGLYADWDAIGPFPERPARVTVVGLLDHCNRQDWKGMMVMGYCHHTTGPILIVSQIIGR